MRTDCATTCSALVRIAILIAEDTGTAVGHALFFHTYSTFLTRPGIYLEDLFVLPEMRGRGHGKRSWRWRNSPSIAQLPAGWSGRS